MKLYPRSFKSLYLLALATLITILLSYNHFNNNKLSDGLSYLPSHIKNTTQIILQVKEQASVSTSSTGTSTGTGTGTTSSNDNPLRPTKVPLYTPRESITPSITLSNHKDLFHKVFSIIKQNDPELPKFNKFKSGARIPNKGNNNDKPLFTKEYLSNYIDLSNDQLDIMTETHTNVTDSFAQLETKDIYKGSGIVYVGGGRFNWLTLMSIKSLRSLGSHLPVEVLIPDEGNYEEHFCTVTLPMFNAKCLYLPEILGNETFSLFKFGGYQLKSIALLVSSFEKTLLFDADNLPVYIPDKIFQTDPFKSKGLVTWPDFWRRSTSPDFYKIANIELFNVSKRAEDNDNLEINPERDLPMHRLEGSLSDPSSESGQVLINKKTHLQTLLLSLYYNTYGPTHYYPLLSQGTIGEGDKETFLAAAVALQQPYHQVQRSVHAVGRFKKDGHFVGCAMGQFDPIQDYENSLHVKEVKGPQMLFIHANYPKLHPGILRRERRTWEGQDRVRMFGPMKGLAGYDFEMFQWRNMEYLICELDVKLKTLENEKRNETCKEIRDHLKFMELHP